MVASSEFKNSPQLNEVKIKVEPSYDIFVENTEIEDRQKAYNKDLVPRAVFKILQIQGYDWDKDYFDYKIYGFKKGDYEKEQFLKSIKESIYSLMINKDNWDDKINDYGEKWERICERHKGKGITELFKPLILSKVSGSTSRNYINRNSKVDEIVTILKTHVSVKTHPITITRDFSELMTRKTTALQDSDVKTFKRFLKFLKSEPEEHMVGMLLNMATTEEYQLDYGYFTKEKKSLKNFMTDYRNKIFHVDDAKEKMSRNSFTSKDVYKNKVGKTYKNVDSRGNFKVIRGFFMRQFNIQNLEQSVFKRLNERYCKRQCVACGRPESHNWRNCEESDILQ